MTPISFDQNQTFLAVAFIDAVYRVDLKSANGMTVRVTPLDGQREQAAGRLRLRVAAVVPWKGRRRHGRVQLRQEFNGGTLKVTGTMTQVK